jgi:hypothetical protein
MAWPTLDAIAGDDLAIHLVLAAVATVRRRSGGSAPL